MDGLFNAMKSIFCQTCVLFATAFTFVCVSASDISPDEYSDQANAISQAYTQLQQLQQAPGNNNSNLQQLFNNLQSLKQQLAGPPQNRHLTDVYGIEALLYLQANRYEDALRLLDRALFTAQQFDLPVQSVVWHIQQGNVYDKMGNTDAAIASYENAALAGELLDTTMVSEHPLMSGDDRLYTELAALYLRKAGLLSGNVRTEFIKAAIHAIENRRATELNDYFKIECMTRSGLVNKRITDKLDQNSAFLYPVVYPDRIELIFGNSTSIDVISTAVDAGFLTSLALDLRENLTSARGLGFKEPAIALYNLLIKPLVSRVEIQAKRNLVIIPDIRLMNIPWSALYDATNQQYLIEQYSLAILPSLLYTDISPTRLADASVLYAGLSVASGGSGALIFVEDEIQSLRNITRREQVIMNNQFTRENLLNEISGSAYTIHHLATHASLAGNFNNSYITTFNGPLKFNALLKSIASNKYQRDAMEMVVLNGCSTASGDHLAALGLAGLTVISGAKSVLGTLWQVNDEAAMLLMAEFYKNLNNNTGKSTALQNAQLHILKSQDNFAHPAYWSAFMLIGNWL